MYLIIKKKKNKKVIYEVIFIYDVINIFKSIGPVLILRNQNVCVCVYKYATEGSYLDKSWGVLED